ncbi:MAG: hypothetical protein QOE30_4253 [Mycobacterium sp.]|uniref:hypothetical protein n=1 Tax=Mycobacterium sp. TaxID=1785 RepID=UPI0028B5F3CE|nr:hypothetical protein [Mycobacterium sp.]MDT5118514.1 hypothetical protein [Mycobacterium sp.]
MESDYVGYQYDDSDKLRIRIETHARFTVGEIRRVFPSVERHVIDSALVFADAEAAVRFYATNRIDLIQDRPEDGSHRAAAAPGPCPDRGHHPQRR